MNLNLRKSVLLVGALASLGLSYTTEALATSPNFAVNSVQQSKKVTGNVSDAEGPIIGASVVEKGNAGNGTVTDLDGNFSLNVKPGATIVITLKSATYWVSWDFACKRQKFILLYIFLA